MPLYEYICDECLDVREEIRPYGDRDNEIACVCGTLMERLPSNFYTTPESLYGEYMGVRLLKNDYDDPWEGSSLEGRGTPNKATYKQKKIQVDLGVKTNVGAKRF